MEFEKEINASARGERRCIRKGRQWFRSITERVHKGRSKCVAKLKNRKAAGTDQAVNKLMKYGGEGLLSRMVRACLNSHQKAWERAERNEAVRGHSFRSYLVSKKTCLGPCRILGLASRIGTNGIFCTCHRKLVSTSIFDGVHLHQIICYWFSFGQAVRSSQARSRGATLLLPLPRYTVLLGLHCICSFPTTNQHQFMRQIIVHSVRSNALWGGLRHTLMLCNWI